MSRIVNYIAIAIIAAPTTLHAEPHLNIPPVDIDDSGEISAPNIPQLPKTPIIKEEQPMGMKSLKATPSNNQTNQVNQTPPKKQNDNIKEQEISPLSSPMVDLKKVEAKPRVYTLLSPKEALIPIDKLKPWGNISATALGTSKSDAINIIKAIEADRGAVPPQGLFLAAKVLSDNEMMSEAAVYYFVGQMRLSFDMLRWPAYMPNQNKPDPDNKKSPDQRPPNHTKTENVIVPQAGIATLGASIGKPILHWVIKNPTEMERIINAAKAWDLSANYAYDPAYDSSHSAPFEEWEGHLNTARTAYFGGLDNMVNEFKKMKR